ncbi:integrase [Idiomarina abyssalis]|uniref:integrase n=1 Tax=Idiomarina abyssalis TaxID=86102 RepID=UPI0006C837BE|nr:integrase [Idiomarina abyssalis]KPD21241.1 integrase [Idiomarina abyssalis]SFT71938.1 hypothetical protein SAMN04515657_1909 [Idiomarina abyssalis]
MADIFHFKPKSVVDAESNLAAFISKCRNELTVFGDSLDWEAAVWPKVGVFSKLGVTTRKPQQDQLMDNEFIDFAKAYFRYQQGHSPTGTKNELKALRAIEAALLQVNQSARIEGVSVVVLDEAAVLSRKHYSKTAAYHCGRELARLAKFLSENHLINARLHDWRNPIQRPHDTVKTGKQAKDLREKKLPDEAALNALAEIFANNPDDGRDIFTTSVFVMLMSAPSRISEVLALPVDCEVVEKDRNGIERYGWRFYAGKGFEGDIKWIPTAMVSVAKTAVERARRLSADARKVARWIEKHPGYFYRHDNCPDVADDEPLTMKQACQALGFASNTVQACRTSLNNRKLETADGVHTLNSLWQHVMNRMPEGFPWFDKDKGIKFSEALFAMCSNQLHKTRTRSPVELHRPDGTFFNNDLSPRESLKGNHDYIFARHGYLGQHGEKLKITSHQARHLLNTISQRGGLSNLEIAKWSGRADVKQNRTYNHMSEYELVSMAEKLDTSKPMFGPVGDVKKHLPVTSQEFNTLEHAAAHVTEYGYCVHDYTMSPCEKFRDCINCTEQVCVKGEDEKLKRLRKRLIRTQNLLAKAEGSIADGDKGSDRWYTSQEKTIARLKELIAILENPAIEDGAQVKLKGNDFSQLRRVSEKKSLNASKELGSGSDEAKMLDDLTSLLGGGFG